MGMLKMYQNLGFIYQNYIQFDINKAFDIEKKQLFDYKKGIYLKVIFE